MRKSTSYVALILAVLLAAMAASAQPLASVTGSVTSSLTGLPVLRAHVTLRDGERAFGALTDAEGKFSITGIAPGNYQVSAERAGFAPKPSSLNSNGVLLQAGDKKDSIDLKLTPVGAIVGRVLDAGGEPVQLANVSARGLGQQGDADTDDKGQYRIGGLTPGHYRVKAWVNPRNSPPETRTDGSKEVRYAPTFYPGVPSSKGATRVAVQPGSESAGIDVRLIAAPVIKVSGKVANVPAGAKDVVVEVTHEIGPGMSTSAPVRAAKADGAFVVWGLTPGTYTLSASIAGVSGNDLQAAPVELEVGTADIEHIELRLMPPFDISGHLRFEDEQARQAPRTVDEGPRKNAKPRVNVYPLVEGNTISAEIGDDDSFKLEKLPPGRFRVDLQSGGRTYVKSLRLGSVDVDGDIVDLRNGAAGGVLTLMVSAATCEISGTVSDSKGPTAAAMVELLPEQNDGASDVFSATITDPNGKYFIAGLRPGKYRLLAADDGTDDFLMDRSALEDYEDLFVVVELSAGDKVTKDLKKSVLVK